MVNNCTLRRNGNLAPLISCGNWSHDCNLIITYNVFEHNIIDDSCFNNRTDLYSKTYVERGSINISNTLFYAKPNFDLNGGSGTVIIDNNDTVN